MALIGRLFAIFFGFFAACFVAGMVAVVTLLFPEMTDVSLRDMNGDVIDVMIGFGFLLVGGFALVPALFLILITEAFSIRTILAYAILGGLAGLCSYLAFIPFDPATMTFDGIIRRHLEIMVGSGILGGVVYWVIAGRNAGVWRGEPPSRPPPPAAEPGR
ncbi:MAG: hypothetical protein J0G95_09550 [Rhizobiales bacterium]|nr:hypothetical protein [Hyphomicrobiales bacterium]